MVSVVKGKQVNGEELLEYGKYYVMNGGIEPSGYLDVCNTPANTISISEGYVKNLQGKELQTRL